jgi:hypothetical protein
VKRFENHMAGGMALLSVPMLFIGVIVAVFLASGASAWLLIVAVALVVVAAVLILRLTWAMLADGAADEH